MPPASVNIHVGLGIRQRRILPGINMWSPCAAVGLSFQMIQKYDGLYCIPVNRLLELANALDASPSFFFEASRPRVKHAPLCRRETMDLVRAYTTISNSSVRTQHCRNDPGIAATARIE